MDGPAALQRAPDPTGGDRLVGWKAIGAFLGCDARTAKRWEATRAMPVHRVPGSGVPTVWADCGELRAWLVGAPAELSVESTSASLVAPPVVTPLPVVPTPARAPWRQRTLVALLVTGVAAGSAGALLGNRAGPATATATPSVGPYDDDLGARTRYLNARFELGTRSAQGIAAATRDFQALTMRYPDRAAGYSGLADAYVLSREFGNVADSVAFPRAAQAARAALALDPTLADAWLNQAYVLFWWQRDVAGGLAAFREAARRAPDSVKAHHWYATAVMATGDVATARREIAHARELAPDNHAVVADAAFIELLAGNSAAAIPALEALAGLDPDFVAAHRYLALADLVAGRDERSLREAATTARLMGRTEQAAGVARAAARWRTGGRPAMLAQLIVEAVAAEARGQGSLNDVIGLCALAGDRACARHWRAVAEARPVNDLLWLPQDAMMVGRRPDPATVAGAKGR